MPALLQKSGRSAPSQPDAPSVVSAQFTTNLLEGTTIPENKPLQGVGEKEERMYEHIKEEAEKSGR
jgi:hypothetical protein